MPKIQKRVGIVLKIKKDEKNNSIIEFSGIKLCV